MGIEGRVEIRSVRDDKIKAFCVLRNVLAKARSKSYVIRGWYDFDRAGFSDLRLRQAGIELGGARPAAE